MQVPEEGAHALDVTIRWSDGVEAVASSAGGEQTLVPAPPAQAEPSWSEDDSGAPPPEWVSAQPPPVLLLRWPRARRAASPGQPPGSRRRLRR